MDIHEKWTSMKKMAKKEQAQARKRGLGLWDDRRDQHFGSCIHGRDGLHQEMDRLFEEIFPILSGSPSLFEPWTDGDLIPCVDEIEDEKAYHFTMELPSMAQNDVEVSFSNGLLTISGEKKQAMKEANKDFYRRERSFGEFRRCLPVAGGVDESRIEASFEKEVLSILLPKTKKVQKKYQ